MGKQRGILSLAVLGVGMVLMTITANPAVAFEHKKPIPGELKKGPEKPTEKAEVAVDSASIKPVNLKKEATFPPSNNERSNLKQVESKSGPER
jgi:hypothetical protein